ncbi:hypothetical protein [Nocardia takedensis]|uniref:hypothetical protein n=1 Tax=Nocardia takedensis TaxID=259390 RepID=UPI00030C1814|nr:hypothetical protein [Nocardia takedensis]
MNPLTHRLPRILARCVRIALGRRVVTLCGSMRFRQQMLDIAAELTAADVIVLAPFVVIGPDSQAGAVKQRLDVLHRRKIDLAEEIVVVSDETGYFGESTRAEIAYATATGKTVTYRALAATAAGSGTR